MAKGVASDRVRDAFKEHLEQTKEHVERLEQIFKLLGKQPERSIAKQWKGWSKKGQIYCKKKAADGERRRAYRGCQWVEHYEIAAYGTAHLPNGSATLPR